MAVKQSIGDKIAEKVLDGVESVKNFAGGGYKETGKNISEGAKSVGATIAEGAKKAGTVIVDVAKKTGDFCVEKVFGREGETLEETKARIKRREFGVKNGDGDIIIEDVTDEIAKDVEAVKDAAEKVVSDFEEGVEKAARDQQDDF